MKTHWAQCPEPADSASPEVSSRGYSQGPEGLLLFMPSKAGIASHPMAGESSPTLTQPEQGIVYGGDLLPHSVSCSEERPGNLETWACPKDGRFGYREHGLQLISSDH